MEVLTPEQRHKNMCHIKSKDTNIEKILRHALWKKGIKYRKNYDKLIGKPDIALTKYKIVIFCDSEFWHGKDLGTKIQIKTNNEFWTKKILKNIERDTEVNKKLSDAGWTVIRFWGNDIIKNTDQCVRYILSLLN